MFRKLSITACYDVTVRDLIKLRESGHSVYRSSHAGNWSLYKLLLSELGLPDCIWDVTCIYTDVNNQPRYQLIGGKKIHLLGTGDPGIPYKGVKYLTPYYRVDGKPDETLAHFHVAPLQKLFGNLVTTQSEVLLEYRDNLQQVFEVIQKYLPGQLGRYIMPCGCLTTISNSGKANCHHNSLVVRRENLAESAISTIEELKHLVFNPEGYSPKGGVLYSFELVIASHYLWSYWKFGDKTIYELSGPDMIGYATKPDFVSRVEKVLKVLGAHLGPELCPETIDAKIVPTTLFRFGYPANCKKGKVVMSAHDTIRQLQRIKRRHLDIPEIVDSIDHSLNKAVGLVENLGSHWDMFHKPDTDAFYSQHDMLANNTRMVVQEPYLDMTFAELGEIIRALPQIERGIINRRNPLNTRG